jgi:hypothetical protein
MKVSRKNIESTEVFNLRLIGVKVQVTSKRVTFKVIVAILVLLLMMVIIESLLSEEISTLIDVSKAIGGVLLGLMLINSMRVLFYLAQDYLNKLKEKRKRRVIEEKYEVIKEKIENQKSYLKDRFKDSDQLDLLKKHLKKLEEEELNSEIEKIEELKAKF